MAKLSLEEFLSRFKKRHGEGIIKVEFTREQLAQALHKNSHWDNTKSWDVEKEKEWKTKGMDTSKFFMLESSKEDWRHSSDRFVNEIAPMFGIKVIKD